MTTKAQYTDQIIKKALTKRGVREYKKRFHVGEQLIFPCYRYNSNSTTAGTQAATVIAKYEEFMVVNNGKYNWCVRYTDLMFKEKNGHNIENSDEGDFDDE